MNKSSDILWRLIQTMTRNEKLFFKKKSAGVKNGKVLLYIRLFDELSRQKKFDEDLLVKKLAPTISKKNLAVQKNYLHTHLNECLIEYNNRGNAEQEIYKSIQLIRINRKKGLLNEALALWEKTINKARKMELFSMSQLLKREFEKMIMISSIKLKYDDLHTLFKSNIMTYDEYAEMITLRDLYAEILMLRRKAHFDFEDTVKKEISDLVTELGERNRGLQSRSFWHRHYTRMCHATLYYLSGDTEQSLNLIKEGVLDWWENTKYIKTDTEYYIELLYMVNYSGILNGSYKYVELVFNHNVNNLIEDEAQKAHFETVKYLALNKIFNKTARYAEVTKLLESIKKKYAQWEPLINAELNRSMCFSLGISCFVLDNYPESLQFIKRGITYFKDGTRKEHFIFANLYLLLILYNMNNAKLFEAQYKSAYSYFYKKSRPNRTLVKTKVHSFEKILMHCLHDTFYVNSFKEKSDLFQKAVEELEANKESGVQNQTMNIFNFHGWLLSQVQRISYREYVKRNSLKSNDLLVDPK